jgi:hypothetical protein
VSHLERQRLPRQDWYELTSLDNGLKLEMTGLMSANAGLNVIALSHTNLVLVTSDARDVTLCSGLNMIKF